VTTLPQHVRTLIVGAGFAGIGMAAKLLQEQPATDILVIEQAEDIGGTWRDNTYPGCACDVPSNLYSYSFAPNPDWGHTYSRQPENPGLPAADCAAHRCARTGHHRM